MNKQIGNVQLMQAINRVKVLTYFRQHPCSTRPQAAADIGLSMASLTNITAFLIEKKLLEEVGTEKVVRVGRKCTLLRFREEAKQLLCVGISRGAANIFRVNLGGEVKMSRSLLIENLGIEEVVFLICTQIRESLDRFGEENFLGIGLFLSGLVLQGNRFIFSADLNWGEYDFISEIKRITSLPVMIENTTVLNALAYFNGRAYTEDENVIFLDMHEGIGMAYFSRGKVNSDILGELGHTTIDIHGEQCICGNRGCLELMCSWQHALHMYEQETGEKLCLQKLEQLFTQGDAVAGKVIHECAEYLGVALTNIMKLFMPSALVCNMGDYMKCRKIWEEAVSILQENMRYMFGKTLPVREIRLKEKDILIGMSMRICDKVFDVDYFQHT